jgi:hypothetical protein
MALMQQLLISQTGTGIWIMAICWPATRQTLIRHDKQGFHQVMDTTEKEVGNQNDGNFTC